ncbi:P2Y purinoceptor 14-like [Chiloscyllium punctatum]|uniref:P2Y purinoceptor 14-like n=1 Tax=Chiloscyllium punctatum TaxID=137246 RepID=UPI003B63319E
MADSTTSIDNVTGTNSSGNTSCRLSTEGFAIFAMVAYALICTVGIILNSLAFWVYFCHVPNSNSIIIYLKNLVIADFLLVLSLPIKIVGGNQVGSAALRKIYCNFTSCIFYLNLYSSILFLGYIAATRYLKIVKPLKTYAFHKLKSAKIIAGITWSVLLSLGFTYMLLTLRKSPQNSASTTTCLDFRKGSGIYWHVCLHVGGTVLFLCVLTGLCFFYFQTAKRLDKSPSPSSLKKQTKAKNNILILLAVFLVCFVPYHAARLPYILSQINVISGCFWKKTLYHLKESAVVLSTLNACFDPVIYFLFCKAFRSKLGLEKKPKDNDSHNDLSLHANTTHSVHDQSSSGHIKGAKESNINRAQSP